MTAALDLKLIKLLRSAMAAAGQSGGAGTGVRSIPIAGPTGNSAAHDRVVLHPQPRIEPRRIIHPTPRYQPRPVLHPAPRLDDLLPLPLANCASPASDKPPTLPPPWATVAWKMPVPPPVTIKPIIIRVDVHHKGTLLDLFI